MNKDNNKIIKVLSRILQIIAKIAEVVSLVVAIMFTLLAIFLPIVRKDITVTDSEIKVYGNTFAYDLTDEKLVVHYGGESLDITDKDDLSIIDATLKYINNENNMVVIVECYLVLEVVVLVLIFMAFKYSSHLFNNIYNEYIFTKENSSLIKKITIMMICITLIPASVNAIMGLIFKTSLSISIQFGNIIIILTLFLLAYLFQSEAEGEIEREQIRIN